MFSSPSSTLLVKYVFSNQVTRGVENTGFLLSLFADIFASLLSVSSIVDESIVYCSSSLLKILCLFASMARSISSISTSVPDLLMA